MMQWKHRIPIAKSTLEYLSYTSLHFTLLGFQLIHVSERSACHKMLLAIDILFTPLHQVVLYKTNQP